jgi:hypothetical protein
MTRSVQTLLPVCVALPLGCPGSIIGQEVQEVNKLDEIVITATKTPHTLADAPVVTVVLYFSCQAEAHSTQGWMEEVWGICNVAQ